MSLIFISAPTWWVGWAPHEKKELVYDIGGDYFFDIYEAGGKFGSDKIVIYFNLA